MRLFWMLLVSFGALALASKIDPSRGPAMWWAYGLAMAWNILGYAEGVVRMTIRGDR